MTLATPKDHLPPGYPLTTAKAAPDGRKYGDIWDVAFALHKIRGPKHVANFSACVLSPVRVKIKPHKTTQGYCDCYERAYRATA